MKGYWHFTAISVALIILTIYFNNYSFIVILFLWLFYLYYFERLGKIPLFVSFTFFLFFTIYIPTNEVADQHDPNFPTNKQQLQGKIIGPITVTEAKVDFLFQDEQSDNKLLVIYFPDKNSPHSPGVDFPTLKYGATCNINGKIELPDQSRNPGQFDFRNYLSSQGITHQVILNSLDDVHCEGSSFLDHIYSTRMKLIHYVSENISTVTASWLNALVLGDDSQLREETVELFQRWSLSHILAISGLHVGLAVGLLYFILVKLNIVTKERAQWIMIVFLPIYALIAGGQPSVWRASLMVMLFIILNKTKLKNSATDTLSIVFVLLILMDKYVVYHIGFQLSFIVTLGLVLSKQWIATSNSSFYKVLQISFVSQMMILPLQIAYFSTFQPLSILLNVIVVPYFSLFVIPFMFLLLLLSPLPTFFIQILDSLFVRIHHVFIYFVESIDSVGYFPFIIGEIPVVIAVVYYVLFFLFMKNIQNNKLNESFKYGCYITGLIFCIAIRPYLSPVGTVTMLDIGQGDTFIIELPYRKGVYFIDAGASFSFEDLQPTEKVYKHIIKPYLYSRGISKVDAIFLSHEDIDHRGSVPYLVDEMNVKEIFISKFYELESDTAFVGSDVQIKRVNYNESIVLGGHAFHVLAPSNNKHSVNENSLVLYTKLGGLNWLFTGDIGKETEKELINKYKKLQVDVLKVAHHGSNTSTTQTFVEKIKPDYALVPVGVNNSYGHPTIEVLKTLEEEEVFIFRTDKDGAVQFKFRKNEGTFLKYLP